MNVVVEEELKWRCYSIRQNEWLFAILFIEWTGTYIEQVK